MLATYIIVRFSMSHELEAMNILWPVVIIHIAVISSKINFMYNFSFFTHTHIHTNHTKHV